MVHLTSNEGKTVTVYEDRGEVVLAIDGVEATVSVEELARLLMNESPTFVKGMGEIAQRAIITALDKGLDEFDNN